MNTPHRRFDSGAAHNGDVRTSAYILLRHPAFKFSGGCLRLAGAERKTGLI